MWQELLAKFKQIRKRQKVGVGDLLKTLQKETQAHPAREYTPIGRMLLKQKAHKPPEIEEQENRPGYREHYFGDDGVKYYER